MHKVLTLFNEYLLYATSTYSIQQLFTIKQILILCNEYLLHTRVLTLCNEYLLYATSTYSIQQVLTPYNRYLMQTTST